MNISREKIGYRKKGEVDYELIRILKEGGIVAMRTDTVYGLLASAFDQSAVERIYLLKKRRQEKPLIILISDFEMLKRFPIHLDSSVLRFLESAWPGRVSVVVPLRKDALLEEFSHLHRGGTSLAFRIPDDEQLREVITLTGPLVAPSANLEGGKPAQSIQEVIEYFGDTLSFYEDAGVCSDISVSRIVSFLDGEEGRYLR